MAWQGLAVSRFWENVSRIISNIGGAVPRRQLLMTTPLWDQTTNDRRLMLAGPTAAKRMIARWKPPRSRWGNGSLPTQILLPTARLHRAKKSNTPQIVCMTLLNSGLWYSATINISVKGFEAVIQGAVYARQLAFISSSMKDLIIPVASLCMWETAGLGEHGCNSSLNDLACFGSPTDAAHSSQ